MAVMESEPLRIMYESAPEITRIAAGLDAAFATTAFELLVVDYLQHLTHKAAETKEREIAYIANECKAMAERYRCHVMLLAQVNEAGDARWSKEAEDAADVVIRLKKEHAGAAAGHLTIEKHRNGLVGGCEFAWNGTRQTFV